MIFNLLGLNCKSNYETYYFSILKINVSNELDYFEFQLVEIKNYVSTYLLHCHKLIIIVEIYFYNTNTSTNV